MESYHSSGKKVISGEAAVDHPNSNTKHKRSRSNNRAAVNKSASMSDYADQKFEETSLAFEGNQD